MTNIPDWNRLRHFFIVAEAGSFSAAQKKLNLSQSAISRQISALETEIQATLFHRHARGIVLTDQGDLLYQTIKDIYKQIHEAELLLSSEKNTAAGSIKITTTRSFGTMWLSQRLVQFCKKHPKINAELITEDRTLNLSLREADFAIRMWKPRSNDIYAHPFIIVRCHYYASKEYLAEFGTPEKIADLNNHRLLAYVNPNPVMREKLNHHLYYQRSHKRQRNSVYSSSSLLTILHAIKGGLGIATLPDYIADGHDLVRLFPEIDDNYFETYIAYPQELAETKRVKLLQDYLCESAKDWAY